MGHYWPNLSPLDEAPTLIATPRPKPLFNRGPSYFNSEPVVRGAKFVNDSDGNPRFDGWESPRA